MKKNLTFPGENHRIFDPPHTSNHSLEKKREGIPKFIDGS
jgi:hypothetical protein